MHRTIALAVVGLVACGDATPVEPAVTSELRVIAADPAEATFLAEESLALPAGVQALGRTAAGGPLVVADGRAFELDGDLLTERALYARDGEPGGMGGASAVAPRSEGGAWIAAGAGLYRLDALYLVRSAVELGALPARGLSEAASGSLAGLWIAADDGLFRWREGGASERLAVAGATGAATHVAIDPAGAVGAVVIGGVLVTLEVANGKVLSDRPPIEAGQIHGLAAGGGSVYAATSKGILRFNPGHSPAFTRFALAATGDVPALAVAVDGLTGVAWARIEGAIVRVDGDEVTRFVPTVAADGPITVDALGDVWAASGTSLYRFGTGAAGSESVSFATDVLPWISTHCSQCHMNQTQNFEDFEVFRSAAEDALRRVRSGDMPRCDGALRCPSERNLTSEQYGVLEQWIRTGKQR